MGVGVPAELIIRKAWATADEFGSVDLKSLIRALRSEGFSTTDKRLYSRLTCIRKANIKLPNLSAPRRVIARITRNSTKVLQGIAREEYSRWKRAQSEDDCEHRFEG
jgi:hypothetical protein